MTEVEELERRLNRPRPHLDALSPVESLTRLLEELGEDLEVTGEELTEVYLTGLPAALEPYQPYRCERGVRVLFSPLSSSNGWWDESVVMLEVLLETIALEVCHVRGSGDAGEEETFWTLWFKDLRDVKEARELARALRS